MKAIVNTAPGQLEFQDLPTPEPHAGQVRIHTVACGICATDLEMIAGWERTGFPAVPGHEWSGTVDAVGQGVDATLVGRPCVAENVLADGGEVGFEHPGGYAECFLTEAANLQVLPDDFDLNAAALIEPLAVCVRGMNRLGEFDRGGPVLVIGDGPIGLILVMLLQHHGASQIVLTGGRDPRLALARQFGAARTVNYHTDRLDPSAGRIPTIIEASGNGAALNGALDLAAPQARILVLGDYGTTRADFPWNKLLHRELTVSGSNASADAWPAAVRLASEANLPLEKLVTHRLPAREFARGMELMRSRRAEVIKVILQWR